jgi:hypothetical protein
LSTGANIDGVDACDVLVVDASCDSPCHGGVLFAARVIGGVYADVFHDHLVGLAAEAVDLEPAEAQHLVGVLAVVNGDEALQQFLLVGEGTVHVDPVLAVAHLNRIEFN